MRAIINVKSEQSDHFFVLFMNIIMRLVPRLLQIINRFSSIKHKLLYLWRLLYSWHGDKCFSVQSFIWIAGIGRTKTQLTCCTQRPKVRYSQNLLIVSKQVHTTFAILFIKKEINFLFSEYQYVWFLFAGSSLIWGYPNPQLINQFSLFWIYHYPKYKPNIFLLQKIIFPAPA